MSALDEEFAFAARSLLAQPFLTRGDDAWPAVVAQRLALIEHFEDICGWALDVDLRRGTARLHKRRCAPDPTRPLRRENGTPMRRGGYALLALAAAELVSRPTTMVGDLADNLRTASLADTSLPPFDPTVHQHRLLFVDALRWFVTNGFAQITAGDLDRVAGGTGDAVIVADPSRFSQLLSASTPPSRVIATTTDAWVTELSAEPRYQSVLEGRAEPDAVNRHARHQLGRRLLDDPCVHVDDLDADTRHYLGSTTGRGLLRSAVQRSGFILEESSDLLVAADPTTEATDRTFGRTTDTITQVAIAILDELTPNRDSRHAVTVEHLEAFVTDLLADDVQWAASYQKPGGAQSLAREALDTLIAFQLVLVTEAPVRPEVTALTDGAAPGHTAATTLRQVRPTPSAGRFVITVVDSRHLDVSEETQ